MIAAMKHYQQQHFSEQISKEEVNLLLWTAPEIILCKTTGRDLSLISVLSNKLVKTENNKLSLQ